MPVTAAQTADDLDRAADLLERDGWRREDYGPTNDWRRAPRCAEGAIRAAAPNLNRAWEAVHAVERDICWGTTLALWNDIAVADSVQVVRALRRTARKLRGASR